MDTYYKVLSIAGSDCCGGAGIQADIKTCSAIGVYAMSVITAITAQNTMGVTGIMNVSPEIVGKQIDAIFDDDLHPDVVKIGMLPSSEIIEVVAERLSKYKPQHIILDPVMVSTSGCKLIDDSAIGTLISRLIPISTLITPNRPEAELLAGLKINSKDDIETAALNIMSLGISAVLIKGGHFDGYDATDYLFTDGSTSPVVFESMQFKTRNTHGTGCTFASAIASYLTLGSNRVTAIIEAKKYISQAIMEGSRIAIGRGHGAVNHFYNPSPLKTHSL